MKKFLIAAVALSGFALQPAVAQDADTMLQEKACVACHATDVQLVGPAFAAVAEKYAGQEDAVDVLVNSIVNGNVGTWGEIPMPPNNISEEDAKFLAEWILEQGQGS